MGRSRTTALRGDVPAVGTGACRDGPVFARRVLEKLSFRGPGEVESPRAPGTGRSGFGEATRFRAGVGLFGFAEPGAADTEALAVVDPPAGGFFDAAALFDDLIPTHAGGPLLRHVRHQDAGPAEGEAAMAHRRAGPDGAADLLHRFGLLLYVVVFFSPRVSPGGAPLSSRASEYCSASRGSSRWKRLVRPGFFGPGFFVTLVTFLRAARVYH